VASEQFSKLWRRVGGQGVWVHNHAAQHAARHARL
jgi:hypothetical protein